MYVIESIFVLYFVLPRPSVELLYYCTLYVVYLAILATSSINTIYLRPVLYDSGRVYFLFFSYFSRKFQRKILFIANNFAFSTLDAAGMLTVQ